MSFHGAVLHLGSSRPPAQPVRAPHTVDEAGRSRSAQNRQAELVTAERTSDCWAKPRLNSCQMRMPWRPHLYSRPVRGSGFCPAGWRLTARRCALLRQHRSRHLGQDPGDQGRDRLQHPQGLVQAQGRRRPHHCQGPACSMAESGRRSVAWRPCRRVSAGWCVAEVLRGQALSCRGGGGDPRST